MTDHDAREALAQAAERIFDFANEPLRQPSPKSEQDFTDPANYWYRAALASLPAPHSPEQCANIAQKSEQSPATGGFDWRSECEWLLDLDEIHVGEEETEVLGRIARIRAALANHSPDAGGVGEDAVRARAIAIVVAEAEEMGWSDEDLAAYRRGEFDGDDLLALQAVESALRPDPRGEG